MSMTKPLTPLTDIRSQKAYILHVDSEYNTVQTSSSCIPHLFYKITLSICKKTRCMSLFLIKLPGHIRDLMAGTFL